ncbi:MAG: phage tail protein [Caldilineaceae bacterium]|nr:phage tail protein [Caldilineaceae bacterium]
MAEALLQRVPFTRDRCGGRAFWDANEGAVLASGLIAGATPIFRPEETAAPSDLTTGFDGVLYLAVEGRVALVDLRGRWSPVSVALDGFVAWRLAADPMGGVWVLDREKSQLARVRGLPLADHSIAGIPADALRPCEENPDPPRLTRFPLALTPGDNPVALACQPETGALALLCWTEEDDAVVYLDVQRGAGATRRVQLAGAHHPFSAAWVTADRLAVLTPGLTGEALVYEMSAGLEIGGGIETERVEAVGDFYPLRNFSGNPFAHGLELPPHYVTTQGLTALHPLSLTSFAPRGEASARHSFDSGDSQTVWHRLYLEAVIPPHCGIRVLLAASDSPLPPAVEDEDEDEEAGWFEHQFGEQFSGATAKRKPLGAWAPQPSEIAFHPGFLPCECEKDRAGLFTVLIQRHGLRVTTLRGRFLHVRAILSGDGRSTPELYALRAYASRFSYVDNYLPELYQELLFGPAADESIGDGKPLSAADFLERFIDNFEGILTPLEERIADAWLLTDPRGAPDAALEWLGSWIGMAYSSAHPAATRRTLLANAPELFRRRGTLAGLAKTLEIVTGGALSGGEIVIVENWRLRRTFATILGADLAAEEDPLLAGLSVSGNSFVGDTLFIADLSDAGRKEFLALFAADLPKSDAEEQAVVRFLDRLAYRVTLLVHQEVNPQDLG